MHNNLFYPRVTGSPVKRSDPKAHLSISVGLETSESELTRIPTVQLAPPKKTVRGKLAKLNAAKLSSRENFNAFVPNAPFLSP